MEKLYIREITTNDIEIINKWRNDKETIDSLGTNFRFINLETDKEWMSNYQKNRNNQVRCAICLEETIIGMVNLTVIDHLNGKAEFSLIIGDRDQRGKGFGLKASKLILEHAFNNLNLNKVYLTVLEYNNTARKLYATLGFKEEGVLREDIYKNGKYENSIYMSILKQEFK